MYLANRAVENMLLQLKVRIKAGERTPEMALELHKTARCGIGGRVGFLEEKQILAMDPEKVFSRFNC